MSQWSLQIFLERLRGTAHRANCLSLLFCPIICGIIGLVVVIGIKNIGIINYPQKITSARNRGNKKAVSPEKSMNFQNNDL
jgi:hypothetical protein